MTQHVNARNAKYAQCLQPVPPSPSPSPKPSPPPTPPAAGNWTHPILVPAKLPYTSLSVTVSWLMGGTVASSG